tara:strand:+ start:124 stop:450 length:327 start_codon:yes stop_codon:yes gene_type:complete
MCAQFVKLMDNRFKKYEPQGFKGYLVLMQDTFGNPVTPFFCKQWRDQNNYSMTLLYEVFPEQAGKFGAKETSMVLNEHGVITYKVHGDGGHIPDEIEAAVVEELAIVP